MAQITVLDSTGATQTVAKVTNTGTDVDANSLPVAWSTEGKAQVGAVTETAPASDTASSGLNGRLQRISQRITSLIAVTPPLGTTTDSASSPVAWSAEAKAQIGSLNETAPASDTASAGLNGRQQRIAQRLSTLIALTPSLGTAADVNASPVAWTTEGKAQVGSITETAPASDTASSGLNGRLQRVAQNLTTINTTLGSANAQLPATLGSAAAASSLGVTASTEDIARVGIITETAPASDTASSGLNGRLQRVAQNVTTLNTTLTTTNGRLPTTTSGSVITTITRPANTTAYTAGDVLGGAITISTGLTSGQRCLLTSIDLMPQIAAIPAGMTSFRLYLYSVTPPSALADNAVWTFASGDRASFMGYVDVGSPALIGATLFCQLDIINKQLQLAGSANLFAYLVTNGGFTPAANSEVYQLRTHFVGL